MPRIKHISIPQPCTENWQQMTPTDKGRHCQSCCKTVIDFNEMSNADVISHLSLHKNTCGRIDDSKLAAVNYQLELTDRNKFSFKRLFAAASFSMIFPAMNVDAQTQQATVQMPYALNSCPPVTHSPGKITLSGTIKAADDNVPLVGVSIVVKGTSMGTQTDVEGMFKLKALNASDTLVISSIGYKPVEMPVGKGAQNIEICLEMATKAITDVSVVAYGGIRKHISLLGAIATIHKKLPFYLRWWYWLKHQVQHLLFPSTTV